MITVAGAVAGSVLPGGGYSVGGKIFKSTDPYVADLANKIEKNYPGHVVDVNKVVKDSNGKIIIDFDIETQNAVLLSQKEKD